MAAIVRRAKRARRFRSDRLQIGNVVERSPRRRNRYDRGAGKSCVAVTCAGGATIRVQTLPEQKNLPSAQASTRSEFGFVMVMVA